MINIFFINLLMKNFPFGKKKYLKKKKTKNKNIAAKGSFP